MDKEELQGSMFSRMGKHLHKWNSVISKSKDSPKGDELTLKNDLFRNFPPALKEKRKLEDPIVNVEQAFRYHKSDDMKPREKHEELAKIEGWRKDEAMVAEELEQKKKKAEETEYLKQSAVFRSPERKIMISAPDMDKSKPIVGQYHPKYTCVHSDGPQWPMSKTPKVSVFDEAAALVLANAGKEFVYDVNKSHNNAVKGGINFRQQLERKNQLFVSGDDPHEGRFEPFDATPEVSSKYRKNTSMVSMDRTNGRSSSLFKSTLTGKQYDPKFDYVQSRLDKGAVAFDKMNNRGTSYYKSLPYLKASADPDNVEKFYKAIDRKKSIPQYRRNEIKEEDKKDPLPAFLKGLNNRIGVMMMGERGLKENNFRNGQFLSAVSSFKDPVIARSSNASPKPAPSPMPPACSPHLSKILENSPFVIINSRIQLEEEPESKKPENKDDD